MDKNTLGMLIAAGGFLLIVMMMLAGGLHMVTGFAAYAAGAGAGMALMIIGLMVADDGTDRRERE